jgi:predicted transcriptional regulator
MTEQSANPNNLELTAGIVSAYVANNSLQHNELPALLHAVHDALIPGLVVQNRCAQSRRPMDIMRQGWSMSLFHAAQQWSRMTS